MLPPLADCLATLPPSLQPYQALIAPTLAPCVVLTLAKSRKKTVGPEGRIGGLPTWPLALPYPTGSNGTPLVLFAQLNFQELPPVLEGFPRQGLLQVFLHPSDTLYGQNPEDDFDQANWRLVYHPVVPTEVLTDYDFLTDYLAGSDVVLPHNPKTVFTFGYQPGWCPLGVDDGRFNAYLPALSYEANDALWDDYAAWATSRGTLLGGHPAFYNQGDPRETDLCPPDSWYAQPAAERLPYLDARASEPLQLLQADSYKAEILWGDAGTAHWLMEPSDLATLRFDRVRFTWSCG